MMSMILRFLLQISEGCQSNPKFMVDLQCKLTSRSMLKPFPHFIHHSRLSMTSGNNSLQNHIMATRWRHVHACGTNPLQTRVEAKSIFSLSVNLICCLVFILCNYFCFMKFYKANGFALFSSNERIHLGTLLFFFPLRQGGRLSDSPYLLAK